jgi:hypothetical protein
VVCLSYLAAAELWQVPPFPRANQGAEAVAIDQSIAANGPMVAAYLKPWTSPTRIVFPSPQDPADW